MPCRFKQEDGGREKSPNRCPFYPGKNDLADPTVLTEIDHKFQYNLDGTWQELRKYAGSYHPESCFDVMDFAANDVTVKVGVYTPTERVFDGQHGPVSCPALHHLKSRFEVLTCHRTAARIGCGRRFLAICTRDALIRHGQDVFPVVLRTRNGVWSVHERHCLPAASGDDHGSHPPGRLARVRKASCGFHIASRWSGGTSVSARSNGLVVLVGAIHSPDALEGRGSVWDVSAAPSQVVRLLPRWRDQCQNNQAVADTWTAAVRPWKFDEKGQGTTDH
eukprot:scaffold2167_cov363-Pavlova_lutheri.AAC.15